MSAPLDLEDKLLLRLQQGLPLVWNPYEAIAQEFGLSEEHVLDLLKRFRNEGKVRRIGAVFNVSQLGYRSSLCGIACPAKELSQVAAILDPHPGITHCYSRSGRPDHNVEPLHGESGIPIPNLWFTLSTLGEEFDANLSHLQELIPYTIRIAPAVKKFKVQVVLDPSQATLPLAHSQARDTEIPTIGTEFVQTSHPERILISRLHQDLPDCSTPYESLCKDCGYTPENLLALFQKWKAKGALRRIALLARHQKLGFSANAMCTWNIPFDQIQKVGEKLASRREVTHCYERETFPGFPFNMFAMVHAGSEDALSQLVQNLCEIIQFPIGILFHSVQEYKKTSLIPFREFL